MTVWQIVRIVACQAAFLAIVVASSAAAGNAVEGGGQFDPTRFYAYFTIQSNLIGIVALLWAFRRRNAPPSRRLDLFRGAAAAYLTATFFVVIFFLQDVDVELQVPWIDAVLHRIFPVIVVLDWLIDPPDTRLRFRDALLWLIYPLVWLGFTLVRGAADGWYPYPFLDPANGGYGTVAAMAVGITIGFLAVSAVYIWLGNWRAEQTKPGSGLQEPHDAVPPEPPGWERMGPQGPGTPP
jgi:peptidoglycan/LPS O-acetylase OafA/YrhL